MAAQPGRVLGRLELALTFSGLGLSVFMVMHLGLLFSVLLGTWAMDGLAGFLERYYLLHIGGSFLLLFLVGHVFVASRKVPTAFGRQRALLHHMRSINHMDTWTWLFQGLSGVALLALAAIHLWVIATDLPIEAAKSGARVFQTYLWFYVPLVLLVEGHISIGLARAAAKWGLLSRPVAHRALLAWTAVVLGLGFAILVTLYRLGGTL
ncbi:MAG: succinate dehydrogenase/fumarate reductase cytochrome b subunit [Chloroflexi bacterium]|nr:succinate dehydrogenase/fumarate reductase cytochrome b subunit [Chloroflexota bacterium]